MKRVQMWCKPKFKKFAERYKLDNDFKTLEDALDDIPNKINSNKKKKNENIWPRM